MCYNAEVYRDISPDVLRVLWELRCGVLMATLLALSDETKGSYKNLANSRNLSSILSSKVQSLLN